MGAASSRLEKALGEQFPEGGRYFGLENFGNTCYCNSVLQVEASTNQVAEQQMQLYNLPWKIPCEVMNVELKISNQRKKTGVIAPKRFIQRLKKQNEIFHSYMHQNPRELVAAGLSCRRTQLPPDSAVADRRPPALVPVRKPTLKL